MITLTSFNRTDFVDDHVAADLNNLIASTLRSEYKNLETLSATRTLLNGDTPIQRFECGAADRTVKLPTADSVNNHPYAIINASAAARTITLQNNAGSTTHALIGQGESAFAIPDGNGGYFVIMVDRSFAYWTELAADPATPATGKWKIYFKSGGMYIIDDTGTVAGPAGANDFVSPLVSAEISITGATTATLGRMHVASGSSNYVVALPTAVGNAGKFVGMRFTNTDSVTIDPDGSETLDDVTPRIFYYGQVAVWMSNGTNWVTLSMVGGDKLIEVFHEALICSTAETKYMEATQRYNTESYPTTPADGVTWDLGLWRNKGVYTVTVLGITNSSGGKLDWTLDGISQTTGQDWYSASPAANVEKTFTLTVSATGYHILRATVNGKNGSSSNYSWEHTKITIKPTAY